MSQQTFYQPNRRRREEDDAPSDNQGWSSSAAGSRSSEVSNNAQRTIDNIDDLLNEEESPAEVTSSGAAADSEQLRSSEEGGGTDNPMNFTGGKNLENGRQNKFRGMITRRRVGVAGGVAGVGLFGGILGLSLLSGPFEFIHAAQILQQLHFSSNEDFGDSRGSKVLLYALAGAGAERTRLGKVMNPVADKWESTLVKDTGLKPIYSTRTGYFRGFEITDEAKARDKMPELFDDSIEGTKVTTAADAAKDGQGVRGTRKLTGGDTTLPGDTKIIDVKDMTKLSAKRSLISTVGKATDTNKLVSTVASRLLKKRGGVDFHPLGEYRKQKEKLADYFTRRQQDKAKEVETGETSNTNETKAQKDKNGDTTNQEEISANNEAKSEIEKAAASPGRQAVQDIAKKVGKGGLALGILCAAKGFGDDIPKYKYTHDALPMIRMGMSVITTGNEVMSGQDVNMDELAALDDQFYDPQTKTSFFDAKSIKYSYNENMQGAVDVPQEAQLGNIDSKPAFFSILDNPVLGGACDVLNGVSDIPVIGGIVQKLSGIATGAIDGVLGAFGTSLGDLMDKALAVAAGKGVDSLAKGGQFGALADSGAFLAANDNAMSMGGAPMTPTQTAELNASTQSEIKQQRASESIASRYLNPYDYASLVGTAIDAMPHSITQVADGLVNPLQQLGSVFGQLGSILTPHSSAATIRSYDYGVPQFGFSLADQNNPEFEDPYANAAKVEPKLDELNSKYGKCFGMTATLTSDGVKLDSASMGSDDLNQFKIAKNSDCTGNSDDFLRYRFYLADAVAASSLACDETNDAQSCANVGIDDTSATTPTSTPPTSPGTYKNPLRDLKNIYPERIDGGVDYNANDGPIYAVGDGKVIGVRTGSSSGWPGNPGLYLLYKLTDGPAQGKYVYMAEDCTPTVQAGDTVTADTKICDYHYSGTAMEMGWSNGSYGYLTDDYNSHGGGSYASNSGQDFSKFLVSLGAPPGKVEGTKSTVPMPAGWPTW